MGENHDRTRLSFTDLESYPGDASLGEKAFERFTPPVRIHVHSVRKRLTDADGISAKAIIDGLCHAGILWDDSPVFVEAVTFSQEKGKEEKTYITITDSG